MCTQGATAMCTHARRNCTQLQPVYIAGAALTLHLALGKECRCLRTASAVRNLDFALP